MSSNVSAQPTASTTPITDPQDGPNEIQTADNSTDKQKDGETNDDHSNAKTGQIGDGDGEQKDQTELKK